MKPSFLIIPLLLASASFISGCGTDTTANGTSAEDKLSVDLNLPDSITGGKALANRAIAQKIDSITLAGKSSTGEPCAYLGIENDDEVFDNGYKTTRFMVSTMAAWTCIADFLIDIADVVVHDGSIVETDNDLQSVNYDDEDPTHYSVTDDSDTQTTIRMYYGYDRASPPTENDLPGFYISWNSTNDTDAQGRMIIDASGLSANRPAEDPVRMRMDFNFNADSKNADMFLQFDSNNPWAEGMRIDITKDLQANLLEQVYTARGLIKMSNQFLAVSGISEIPNVQFYTVADGMGNGAAIEEIQNMSLPLEINNSNHLGNYLFTKRDIYFFEDDMDWEYIYKTVTSSSYRGGRTTAASGGSWVPFDPSLDMIKTALSLDPDYFSGNLCANIDDDCSSLLNAIFVDGFAGQEQNQGSDPLDWRSSALGNAVYLQSVYPNGTDWSGAFVQSFNPVP